MDEGDNAIPPSSEVAVPSESQDAALNVDTLVETSDDLDKSHENDAIPEPNEIVPSKSQDAGLDFDTLVESSDDLDKSHENDAIPESSEIVPPKSQDVGINFDTILESSDLDKSDLDKSHKNDVIPEPSESVPFESCSDLPQEDGPGFEPVPIERTLSVKDKENPFTRSMSESDDHVTASAVTEEQQESVIPKISNVDVSKPAETKKPMVVSVGTIEVGGTNKYEDINIMSKGSDDKKPELETKKEPSDADEKKDYESLRDLRFSSISIYDKPHFEEDIVITVEDAQKHAAESFVSYKVVTTTTRESFLQHEFHVRRRYQDFLWLSNILIQQYPSHIIPPLPQKKLFNKYDPNFIRLRQLALNKFLCRIAEHPILSASEHFFTFLSAKQVELIEQKKSVNLKRFVIPQIPLTNTESPFTSTSDYIEEFGKVLGSLATQLSKLDKEQVELVNALNALSPSVALWANFEGNLEPILSKLGESAAKMSEELEHLVEQKEEIFSEGIKEYQLYINTVKSVLKARDHLQITKDYYTDTVLTREKELEKLEASEPGKSFATLFGKSPAQVKEEKIVKLKNDITSLSANGEKASDELEVASASIRSDLERWKINKEKDFRNLVRNVAESHVTYFEKSSTLWKDMVNFTDDL